MNVLLVEDDAWARESVSEFLRSEGHAVVALNSGEEAFNWLDQGHSPDLLIADYLLSGPLTGVDVVKRLRTRAPAASYLCMTGNPESARSRLYRWVFCDVLVKPFTIAELAHAINAAVARPSPGAAS